MCIWQKSNLFPLCLVVVIVVLSFSSLLSIHIKGTNRLVHTFNTFQWIVFTLIFFFCSHLTNLSRWQRHTITHQISFSKNMVQSYRNVHWIDCIFFEYKANHKRSFGSENNISIAKHEIINWEWIRKEIHQQRTSSNSSFFKWFWWNKGDSNFICCFSFWLCFFSTCPEEIWNIFQWNA